jgi:hypothetical protein
MAADSGARRQPTFTEVDQLRPGTHGHNLIVKVVDSKMVVQRGREGGPQGRQMRIAECLVGDETGIIVFTARNDQGSPALLSSFLSRFLSTSLQQVAVSICCVFSLLSSFADKSKSCKCLLLGSILLDLWPERTHYVYLVVGILHMSI